MAHREEWRGASESGYTLIEIVVALLLFTVGGLALVATSAVIGRELNANATRERAGRIAATRLEILRGRMSRRDRRSRERVGESNPSGRWAFPTPPT